MPDANNNFGKFHKMAMITSNVKFENFTEKPNQERELAAGQIHLRGKSTFYNKNF
jgi:hypothetical protein